MAHGIFRGDNVTSITDPAKIRTIQVYADIDNGAPITLGALAASGKYAGEAEVFTTATANGAAAANVWVVTTPDTSDKKYIAAGDGGWTVSNANTKAFAQYLGSDVQDGVTFYAFEVL